MEILDKNEWQAYRQFIETHPNGHLLQSPEWAKVKLNWKWEAIVEKDESGAIIGAMSVLIRKIPATPFSIMYSPRGPVCDLDNAEIIRSLISGTKALARQYRACVFTIDPNVTADNEPFKQLMAQMGLTHSPNKDGNDGIQKPNVFRLNVSGKTEEEVMAHFSSKTRYNIRVAQRHNVEVKIEGQDRLDDFLSLMRQTGLRDGFPIRPKEYFQRILNELQQHARLYMAYYEGEPVAGAIAVVYGDKAWYLYGASSNNHRNTMPNYLMQWEMIKWSIECGCSVYDFRGASADESKNNALYGLYRFKKGFNGDYVELIGEYDLIYNRLAYRLFQTGIRLNKSIHSFRLSLKQKKHESKPLTEPVSQNA